MKWFKRNKLPECYEEVHYPHLQPLPHQQDVINRVLIEFKDATANWGRIAGRTSTQVLAASALLQGTEYFIVREVK